MKARRLFLVGIPETHVDRAIARAQALGCEVILGASAERLAECEPLIASADRLVELADGDEHALVLLADRLHRECPLAGIFSFKEDALVAVARLQETYGMRANPPAVVASCIDKAATRRLLERQGIRGPRYAGCRTLEETRQFAEALGRPVILKPPDRQGSLGVTVAASGSDLAPAFEASRHHSSTGLVLVEELLTGQEISIEAMVFRGQTVVFGVTEKMLFPGTFVESGHVSPSRAGVSPEKWKPAVSRIVAALGIRYGPMHIEGFLTSRGFAVGEVHTRYGGDHITTITELTRCCDMHTPVFAELLRLPYDLELHPPSRVAGVRFIQAPEGIICTVQGVDQARQDDAIIALDVQCQVGDVVPPLRSSFDRRGGWVIAVGRTPTELVDTLTRAVETVQIHSRSEGGGQWTVRQSDCDNSYPAIGPSWLPEPTTA